MEKQITVLISDDNEVVCEGLKSLLTLSMEYVSIVGTASNGVQAIELARELLPDIILMDINMSPINGFEATREILQQNPATKIIGLSMHSERSYAEKMFCLGAQGYVAKSAPANEIIEAIKKVADGGKYGDQGLPGQL